MSETTPHTIHVDENELRREPPQHAEHTTTSTSDPLARLYRDLRPALDTARSAAAGASGLVRQHARVYADRTSAYVTQQPLKSVAIAAAGGAMLAMLMGKRRHR